MAKIRLQLNLKPTYISMAIRWAPETSWSYAKCLTGEQNQSLSLSSASSEEGHQVKGFTDTTVSS